MFPRTYVTITGLKHYELKHKVKVGDSVLLIKDTKNEVDEEAIAVFTVHKEKFGYVANSTHTVAKGTYSAGRLYDKFDTFVVGVIQFMFRNEAIVEVMLEDVSLTYFDELYFDLFNRTHR